MYIIEKWNIANWVQILLNTAYVNKIRFYGGLSRNNQDNVRTSSKVSFKVAFQT